MSKGRGRPGASGRQDRGDTPRSGLLGADPAAAPNDRYGSGDLHGMDFTTTCFRPLRALKPQDDDVKIVSYLKAQAAGGFLASPVAHFQTNLILRGLSGAAIEAITAAIEDAPAACKVIIVPLRGAVCRVEMTDTAFSLREPGYEIDMAGVWNTPALRAEVVRWVQATRDSLMPFAHGVYINQLGDTSDQLVRSGYGPNYDRLVEIKKKYDPNNVLRLNQNIKPASASSEFLMP